MCFSPEDPEIDPVSSIFLGILDAVDSFLNPRFDSSNASTRKAASIKQQQQAEESIEVQSYYTRYGSVTLHSIYSSDGIREIHSTTTNTSSSDSLDSVFSLLESGDLHGTFSLLETSRLQYNNIGHNLSRYYSSNAIQNGLVNLFEDFAVILDVCRERKRMMELGYHHPRVLFPNGEPVFRPTAIAQEDTISNEDTSIPVIAFVIDGTTPEPEAFNETRGQSPVTTPESTEARDPSILVIASLVDDSIPEPEAFNEARGQSPVTPPESNEARDQSTSGIAPESDDTANEDTTSNEGSNTNEEAPVQPIPVVEVFPERPTTWRGLMHKRSVEREQRRRFPSRSMHSML